MTIVGTGFEFCTEFYQRFFSGASIGAKFEDLVHCHIGDPDVVLGINGDHVR